MLDLGVNGRDGRDGAKGATGAQGVAGAKGATGIRCVAGPRGERGQDGHDGAGVPRELALLVKMVPQVLVGNVVFQEQTVQKERPVPKALQVSVDLLVPKEMLDLVVSTVVMVVTERKVRLVLKALLVQRVPRVSKVLLAHVENVVATVMMVDLVAGKDGANVLVGNVVFQVRRCKRCDRCPRHCW